MITLVMEGAGWGVGVGGTRGRNEDQISVESTLHASCSQGPLFPVTPSGWVFMGGQRSRSDFICP